MCFRMLAFIVGIELYFFVTNLYLTLEFSPAMVLGIRVQCFSESRRCKSDLSTLWHGYVVEHGIETLWIFESNKCCSFF